QGGDPSHEGQAYWVAMNLAADYAEACHELIHYRMGKSLGLKRLCAIGNPHNMAWQEIHGNRSVVVHRKGATPAMKGVVGIIPGSMGTGGYIVEGLGCDQSLQSASHGAGRCMSRQDARNSITWSALGRQLQTAGVRLIGGSLEEAPTAYKDIDAVMAQQSHLVRTVGRFMPSIVRMNKE
ncbi:MAG: RtcB family protein, partial [Paludibacteraceae bacterium]|nr:RtcB family protein [Paludibacteraceae bacterium]